MPGYAKGPYAVDWEDRYDLPRMRRERVENAQTDDAHVEAHRSHCAKRRQLGPLQHPERSHV